MRAEQRHAQQQAFGPLQQPLADHIGRDAPTSSTASAVVSDAEARALRARATSIVERADEPVDQPEHPQERRHR